MSAASQIGNRLNGPTTLIFLFGAADKDKLLDQIGLVFNCAGRPLEHCLKQLIQMNPGQTAPQSDFEPGLYLKVTGLICLLIVFTALLVRWMRAAPGGPKAPLEQLMFSEDPNARASAIAGLGTERRQDENLVEPLADFLRNDRSELVRRNSAWALRMIGPDVSPAVPALEDALDDPSRTVRLAAAISLQHIGRKSAPAVKGLIQAVRDWWEARAQVESVSKQMSDEAREELAFKMQPIMDELYQIHLASIAALGKVGPKAREAVPTLSEALVREDRDARVAALIAISEIGNEARSARDKIQPLLKSDDDDIRRYAVWALGKIGARGSIDSVLAMLDDSNAEVRRNAAVAIQELNLRQGQKELEQRVQRLKKDLHSTDWQKRKKAAKLLAELDTEEANRALDDYKRLFPNMEL